jgi:hypothetical protein
LEEKHKTLLVDQAYRGDLGKKTIEALKSKDPIKNYEKLLADKDAFGYEQKAGISKDRFNARKQYLDGTLKIPRKESFSSQKEEEKKLGGISLQILNISKIFSSMTNFNNIKGFYINPYKEVNLLTEKTNLQTKIPFDIFIVELLAAYRQEEICFSLDP